MAGVASASRLRQCWDLAERSCQWDQDNVTFLRLYKDGDQWKTTQS